MNSKSSFRLWLYIVIAMLPEVIDWLTLKFDTSPRGILLLVTKAIFSACVTTRSYLDSGGKPVIESSSLERSVTAGNDRTDATEKTIITTETKTP